MSESIFRTALTAMLGASLFFSLVFVAIYLSRPWYRSVFGRHLMAFMVILAWLEALPLLNLLGGPGTSNVTRWVYVISYGMLPVVTAWRVWLLLAANRHHDPPD